MSDVCHNCKHEWSAHRINDGCNVIGCVCPRWVGLPRCTPLEREYLDAVRAAVKADAEYTRAAKSGGTWPVTLAGHASYDADGAEYLLWKRLRKAYEEE